MDPAQIFSYLFAVGFDVLAMSVDATTGALLAQTGDAVSGQADGNGAEWWQHVGFSSRPSPPTAGQPAAQGISIKRSDHDLVIASRDIRALNSIGNLKDGETVIWATGANGMGQGKVLLKQDGSVTMFTTDSNAPGGNAVMWRISPTGLQFAAPWGTLAFDKYGFRVTTAGGQSMNLGAVGGLPGPLAALTGYFTISAGLVKLDAPLVLLGPSTSPLVYQPVSYGLSANPLTTPPIPILGLPMGLPIGLICSNSVQVAQ